MELGVQLYGVSAICRETPHEFFTQLKNIGYDLAEPCIIIGTPDSNDPYGFWKPAEIETFMTAMTFAELHAVSCHVLIKDDAWADYDATRETLAALHLRYGIHQFILGCPAPASTVAYTAYAENLKALARSAVPLNCEILLHNGFREFETKWNGHTAFEYLLDACAGLISAQPDVGWIQYGGENPVSFLERNRKHIHSLHYKDLKKDYHTLPPDRCDTEIGTGCLDVRSCYQFAMEQQIPQIIDQDRSDGSIMDDLAQTAKLLRSYTE